MNTLYFVLIVLVTKLFCTLEPVAAKYTQANIWTIRVFWRPNPPERGNLLFHK